MKKLLILAVVAIFVLSFAYTAATQGTGYQWEDQCDGIDCYMTCACANEVCSCWKCCREEYPYQSACEWSDWGCVSIPTP